MEEGQLFRRVDNSCNIDFDFQGELLSSEDFDLAQTLLDELPENLLSKNNEIFGCTDCGDWGGHTIALKADGIEYHWQIDNQTVDLPNWLLPFKEKLNITLDELR